MDYMLKDIFWDVLPKAIIVIVVVSLFAFGVWYLFRKFNNFDESDKNEM